MRSLPKGRKVAGGGGVTDDRCRLLIGDCRTLLQTLPGQSVNCCVTSPPYFGLRDYGMAEQIGLEPTPGQFVAELVAVFREVRRVLRDDGTLWLNLGDSYAVNGGGRAYGASDGAVGRADAPGSPRRAPEELKAKDLIGIPWRVAFALQADGWYLRQDIIWHKPNPMPESVTDRCTKAHEYIFLLSKSARYYYDADAIKEASTSTSPAGNKFHKYSDAYANGTSEEHRTKAGLIALSGVEWETRNRRSVWTVPTQPYSGAHFATFPPRLIEPCILAGCPIDGTVLDPFSGSGTTGQVAIGNARRYIGCELNPAYNALAEQRLHGAQIGIGIL
jgi:DNA modification methylase